jgi:hypothetical protein
MQQFLAQRAGETLQRTLRDPLIGARGFVGCGADDDDPTGMADVAQQRGEKLVQRRQLRRGGDAGGVENEPASGGSPARYRRSFSGCGTPSCLARNEPGPELTTWENRSGETFGATELPSISIVVICRLPYPGANLLQSKNRE